jgi:phosphomevalonate kinase
MSTTSLPTAISAPGKVLLTGGYLVLDRAYTGLVFGLSARIHVLISPLTSSPEGVSISEILVSSPQFVDAVWNYGYRFREGSEASGASSAGVEVTQLVTTAPGSGSKNPFVETALEYALSYIAASGIEKISPASVKILADDEYYSHSEKSGVTVSGKETKKFSHFGVKLTEAHKTGLGSSAALVTAFTGAVLTHYLPSSLFDISSEQGKRTLHNLAQASHCAAQGKVGSGFDVAAAVYGSCVYRRFSPQTLDGLERGSPDFGSRLKKLVDSQWDVEISKSQVSVPKGLRLVMCDVDCGTQTVGMVKKVLSWRKEKADEAETLWKTLHAQNDGVREALFKLAQTQEDISSSQATSEGADTKFTDLQTAISAVRSSIRKMSIESGAPVEPPSQTKLIDYCSANVPGIFGGVVPGAGGYDAIVLVTSDEDNVLQTLEKRLEEWNNLSGQKEKESGEEVDLGKVRILGVREELDGAGLESNLKRYIDWQ